MRPRKTQLNSIVTTLDVKFWTVVDYKDHVRSDRYVCIETDALGRFPHGAAVQKDSAEITPTGRISRLPGRIYRKNVSPEERGCACQCCQHVNGYEEEPDD
jgi:hypothetical protein